MGRGGGSVMGSMEKRFGTRAGWGLGSEKDALEFVLVRTEKKTRVRLWVGA